MKISIPQPCHENWNEMHPEEKGRFCLSCQKCVIDFTKMSDKEVIDLIQKPNQCGRFSSIQLERINSKLEQKNQFQFPRFLRYSPLLIAIGFGGTLIAQEKEKIEISENKKVSSNKADNLNKNIKGRIIDPDGFPMDSAKLIFTNGQSTTSDIDGNFEIELLNFDDYTLYIKIIDKYGSTHEQHVSYKENENLEIACTGYLTGLAVEVITSKKRTFAGKILHTATWPFRQIGKIF